MTERKGVQRASTCYTYQLFWNYCLHNSHTEVETVTKTPVRLNFHHHQHAATCTLFLHITSSSLRCSYLSVSALGSFQGKHKRVGHPCFQSAHNPVAFSVPGCWSFNSIKLENWGQTELICSSYTQLELMTLNNYTDEPVSQHEPQHGPGSDT